MARTPVRVTDATFLGFFVCACVVFRHADDNRCDDSCGWGNWRKVRASILASPRFTFDYYLRSLSEGALGKHCEQLLKSSEKYLAVRDRALFPHE